MIEYCKELIKVFNCGIKGLMNEGEVNTYSELMRKQNSDKVQIKTRER